MILVITGTHEQPFDRLVEAADHLAKTHGEVFVQYGYATHPPARAAGQAMLERDELEDLARRASLIITHGGPGSIWLAFQNGKIPIVVPRTRMYGEHVDDHQVAFASHLERHGRAVVVRDPSQLPLAVEQHPVRIVRLTPPGDAARQNRRELANMLNEWLVE